MQPTKKQGISPIDRGDASRQKLVEAAVKIFGQYGFEGASTRQLAAEAGVNISAIPYYFGGKEGLYLATVDHISQTYCASVGTIIDKIREGLKQKDISQTACRGLLSQFVNEMAKFLLSQRKDSVYISRILSREQLDPTPAFDRLYEGVLRESHLTVCSLIARLTGMDPQAQETKLRTQTIFGQLITFKSSREAMLRNMGWKQYGDKEIAAVIDVVEFNIDAILAACRKKHS